MYYYGAGEQAYRGKAKRKGEIMSKKEVQRGGGRVFTPLKSMFLFLALILMLAGSLNASGCGSVPNSYIHGCIPVNVVNTQPIATATGMDLQLSNLPVNMLVGNVMVYNGLSGQPFSTWIESNNLVWVNLGANTIAASGSFNGIIYLGLGTPTTNFFSNPANNGIGESPNLSASYAQYDNGNSIFALYDNFSGTTCNSARWSGCASVTINNGINTNTGGIGSLVTFNPQTDILEVFAHNYNLGNGGLIWNNGDSGFCENPTYFIATVSPNYQVRGSTSNTCGTGQTLATASTTQNAILGVYATSSAIYGYYWYSTSATTTSDFASSTSRYIGLYNDWIGMWIRLRILPPNNVNPTVTYGSLNVLSTSLSISPNPATYGQSITITATCPNPTDTCVIDYPSLGTAIATGTGSATYTWNTTKEGIGTFSSFYANDITQGTNSPPQSLTTYIPINIYYANATTSEVHKKLNTSGLYLIPQCTNNAASLSLGYCIGNLAYSTSTTLSGNIYVFGNITIDSGVTITENGHYLYATETFTNDGTITGGNNTNAPGGAGGDPAGSGTSITTSYAGSGAGGAEGGCVSSAGSGGSTLAAGGTGGSGSGGAAGGSGSTPSAPTMSQSLAINMLNNITKYLSSPSGGGGGGSNGGTGAEGVFGVVIGGNKVIAGTISVNGNSGNGGGSSGDGGGGGGGSGAASILVIYNASYTAGTPSYTGGSGGAGGVGSADDGGQGGAGGNGQLITYQTSIPATNPINYYYPLQYNTTTSSNMINFNVSITNLNTNTKSYHSSNQSLLYLPNKTADYLLSFREQQGTAKVYLNTTFLFNTTTINSDFNLSSLFQYFPILAHTPTWTAKPSSWSIVVANEPTTNQQKNTTKGEQFDSPNLAVSFANAIKLTYPFTSFYLNLTDNPKVQKNITLAKISVIPSATTPAAPTTRKIAFTNSYAAINGTLISPSTASFTAQALFNNYTFTIANNFNISTTNGISEYMQDSNYQNPTISLSNISLAGIKTNYFKTYNNFCPVTIGSNYSTFNQYFVDQAGQDVQYSVLQGSGYGAVGYYMIFQSQYNGSLEQVGSYKITSASPFDYPTEIENAYKFIFLSPNCQKLVYQTPLSLISSPYSITIPITANITLAPELRLNATCTTLNATAIQCSGAGYGPTIHFFTISIYNQSGVFGSTNKVIKQVVINASSYVKVITGLNTSENLKVVSSVNFGDPLNTTISTYYTQFQVHIINLYGMLGPIAMIIMLALMGMFIDGKALPFIGAPIILFVLWAFNIISLTLTYIVGFIIIAVIFIVLMSRDYK